VAQALLFCRFCSTPSRSPATLGYSATVLKAFDKTLSEFSFVDREGEPWAKLPNVAVVGENGKGRMTYTTPHMPLIAYLLNAS
jgi:hypothetical protein